jgi:hypothetical protein
LLHYPASDELIEEKEKVLKEFADVFEGTGKLQGKYHLELDENATLIVHPPRKVRHLTLRAKSRS